jgi:archaellum component FlaG (FlaF/FlaG flagellin family)
VEVTISTAILLIATIIMATVFTGAAISQLYTFENAFKQVSTANQQMFASSITIIGEAQQTSPTSIQVWVKNIGQTAFSLGGSGINASYWDVFLTFPNGTYTRFSYGTSQHNCWSAQILNGGGTGVWENGQTLLITIYTQQVDPGSYTVRITLPNGVSAEDKFSF